MYLLYGQEAFAGPFRKIEHFLLLSRHIHPPRMHIYIHFICIWILFIVSVFHPICIVVTPEKYETVRIIIIKVCTVRRYSMRLHERC